MADGKMTPKERARIEHAQDRQSQAIARQKHDRPHDFNHDGKKDRAAPQAVSGRQHPARPAGDSAAGLVFPVNHRFAIPPPDPGRPPSQRR